ncbi:hypothetical protein ABVF61_15065 [Roseibium sp. HPY-6]|uniref:hypothetical protein n=1 Tax=Roseibium sp. HPY-6 TaxID=3229852 RepID=UPI00338DD82E
MSISILEKSRSSPSRDGKHIPPPPIGNDQMSVDLADLEKSLKHVLSFIETDNEIKCRKNFATFALTQVDKVEVLTKHELHTLSCGILMSKDEMPFVYSDVLEITDKYCGKAMNITMVYKSVNSLTERGFVAEVDPEKHIKNPKKPRCYIVTKRGGEAFELAVIMAYHLTSGTSEAA